MQRFDYTYGSFKMVKIANLCAEKPTDICWAFID